MRERDERMRGRRIGRERGGMGEMGGYGREKEGGRETYGDGKEEREGQRGEKGREEGG